MNSFELVMVAELEEDTLNNRFIPGKHEAYAFMCSKLDYVPSGRFRDSIYRQLGCVDWGEVEGYIQGFYTQHVVGQ